MNVPTEHAVQEVAEAREIFKAAESRGVPLRLAGGVAVALLCPSALDESLRRSYQDLDFVTIRRRKRDVELFFTSLGYAPDGMLNSLHGDTRLFFIHETRSRVDVFVNAIIGCHHLELRNRIDAFTPTIPPADLLLSKLQIMDTNEKDLKDAVSLLTDLPLVEGNDQGIDVGYLAKLCSNDWGLWRTTTLVAERVRNFADAEGRAIVVSRIDEISDAIEQAPKTRRWRLRASVGERVRWYETPEEEED